MKPESSLNGGPVSAKVANVQVLRTGIPLPRDKPIQRNSMGSVGGSAATKVNGVGMQGSSNQRQSYKGITSLRQIKGASEEIKSVNWEALEKKYTKFPDKTNKQLPSPEKALVQQVSPVSRSAGLQKERRQLLNDLRNGPQLMNGVQDKYKSVVTVGDQEEEDDENEETLSVLQNAKGHISVTLSSHNGKVSANSTNHLRPTSLNTAKTNKQTDENRTKASPKEYRFHIRELSEDVSDSIRAFSENEFAGRRDVMSPESAEERKIISSKGTVRGYRNRIRAGIRTYVEQFAREEGKTNYQQLEKGKIIIYTTSMAVVRDTHDRCRAVKTILQTHMVRYEERDLCLSRVNQKELMVRLEASTFSLPQVFADGLYLGDLEMVDKLNECGELRKIFKNFTRITVFTPCDKCGGYRFIPCDVCHGNKKSMHRNDWTAEFCALRCMHCDENGLIRCRMCLEQQE